MKENKREIKREAYSPEEFAMAFGIKNNYCQAVGS